jgi:hypothetical protein
MNIEIEWIHTGSGAMLHLIPINPNVKRVKGVYVQKGPIQYSGYI